MIDDVEAALAFYVDHFGFTALSNQAPARNSSLRRASSGLVSFDRIRDITRLRVAFERKSVTEASFASAPGG